MSEAYDSIPRESDRTQVRERVGLAAELFGKYGDEILAVIRFNVDDPSRANDIFQDFFVALVRKPVPEYVQDVRGYLYRAVTNDAIDFLRRARNRQSNAQKYAYVHRSRFMQVDPQDRAIQAEEAQRMLQLIEKRLPRSEATVLMSRYGDGLSTGATADKLRLTKRTVSRYLSVAMKRIRRLVLKNGGVFK
ncbi:MAG: sigma-70 family RNA polymerase sigma factor [Sedimentisphaerales bacterium]|jgi:RNA polymerase sigma factor (sigma-70 family)